MPTRAASTSQAAVIPNTRTETRYTVLVVLMVLSVSQALSPWAFMAAAMVLAYVALKGTNTNSPWLALFALGMGIAAVVGVALVPSVGLGSRALLTCALIALLAPIEFDRFHYALATASSFLRGSLLLCVVGFIYAAAGGPHLLAIDNPDGRQALLYLTTLSNSVFPAPGGGAIIRPSFIYDEPGAYAFVIDSVLLASFMVHRRLRREEWQLIIGGMLTFSLAHMLVTLLLLLAGRKLRYALIPMLLLLVLDYYIYVTIDYSLVFRRFTVEDGALVGDNRSELLTHGLTLIRMFPEGVGFHCHWDMQACLDTFGAFGENPAFPAAFYGVLPSLPYYIMLAYLIAASVTSLRLPALGVGLAIAALIAQRPFLFNLGYNLLIVMLFGMYVRAFPFQIYRRNPCAPRPAPMP